MNAESTLQDYIGYIKTFPLNDDPSIFGLHPNADISSAQAETYTCLETLLALQPKEIGSSDISLEEYTENLAQDILKIVPPLFDLNEISKQYVKKKSYMGDSPYTGDFCISAL